MLAKRQFGLQSQIILVLVLFAGLLTACGSSSKSSRTGSTGGGVSEGINTRLLVRQPDAPLPVNQPVEVRFLVEDSGGVSHVDLYLVQQTPTGENNLLLSSDPVPFDQVSFSSSRIFTPIKTGTYEIKVVGYNKLGQSDDSSSLIFEVQ